MAGNAQQLSAEELEARFRAAKDVVERSHCQTIWLLAKGHSTAEVAEIVALSPRWINKLARRYEAEGAEALGDRRRGNRGARPLLAEADLEALRERLKTPPDDGGLWTGPKVARWIAARRGLVHVHAPRGWEALKRSAGRSRRRVRETPGPRRPRSRRRSKKARRDPRRGNREARPSPGRALGGRRTPARPEAGAAPGVGAERRAPARPRPPPVRMALRHGLRHADQWRDGVVSLQRHRQAVLRDDARRVRPRNRRRARPHHPPAARRRRLAHRTGARRARRHRLVYLPPYTPELQPAEHLWPLVDEPVANRHFETLDALDAVLAERCRTLAQDRNLIAANTNFHWWPKSDVAN